MSDQEKNKISWGIIGCGDVTEVKSGPAFNLIDGSHLVAVMRRNALKAEDYAHRHVVPKWYDDADKLLNDPDINAVYIATPPSSHKDYVLKALDKGKHVYVEKPVALNSSEAIEIANAAKLSSTKLSVAHYRRKLPSFRFVKELLEKDTIGDVQLVQINFRQSQKPALVATSQENWRIDPKISGGGYFHDLAPHQLDLMLYYFGEPVQMDGFSMNRSKLYDADDVVNGQMLFKKNITFSGNWNFSVAENESKDECVVNGNKGSIVFPFFGSDITVKNKHGEEQHRHFENPNHVQEPMIGSVVKYFCGEAENPCSIDEAVIVMKMMDAFTKKPKH